MAKRLDLKLYTNMPEQTIAKSLDKAYRRIPIEKASFDSFRQQLQRLFEQTDTVDTEEKLKGDMMDFLKQSFYGQEYKVTPTGRIDCAIHLGESTNHPVGVIFEVKMPSNSSEMVRKGNLNRKAMQEMVLYYLRERVTKKNIQLKSLVITNLHEFFIFDAQEFEKAFYSNKKLLKQFSEFSEGILTSTKTEFFYNEIAKEAIESVKDSISYTWFDINRYKKFLSNGKERNLIELYKIFSPEHLLKKQFQTDSNTLNTKFYSELLYIIGLEEIEDKRSHKRIIVRRKENNRQPFSLLENAIDILDSEDWIGHIDDKLKYGTDREEQIFNVALSLTINWVNRILFLKLLEAQLVKYHKDNRSYSFLHPSNISDFGELNELFFRVLAKRPCERSVHIRKKFSKIPYLNSSLFEISHLERETLRISNLDNGNLPLYSDSVIKKSADTHFNVRTTLSYMLEFLDAYDFSSEGSEDIQENTKTLISASVLGLIFEKINGHQDGAVFTPGSITMFMSLEAVRTAVTQKLNEEFGWECTDFETLADKDIPDILRANLAIDSLKICDPAVGSGHFLVSVLNEIIKVKYELGILVDRNGKRLKKQDWNIDIVNDELIVSDSEGVPFTYIPGNEERQRIQETLFNEKKRIIENCLFGVDINPNAVHICRLRLWIELLKNAYYTKESDFRELETLPNIDINIKQGNSLVYRIGLDRDLSGILAKASIDIDSYRESANRYKNAHDKLEKKRMETMISEIISTLQVKIGDEDPKFVKKIQLETELNKLRQPILFGVSDKERIRIEKKSSDLQTKIQKIKGEIAQVKETFSGGMEWRIMFPEILDSNGRFDGFDCIIGNPPFIQLQRLAVEADVLQKMNYETFERTGDVYCLFYELAMKLLKPGGLLSFISSNKWMRADYGRPLREMISSSYDPARLVDFANNKVFDSATVFVNILTVFKRSNRHQTSACLLEDKFDLKTLSEWVGVNSIPTSFNSSYPWTIMPDAERSLLAKIETAGIRLKDLPDIQLYYGIKTGLNEAFIISEHQKNDIINSCISEEERQRTEEIIRPVLEGRDIKRYGFNPILHWIIATFPSRNYDIGKLPALKKYLESFGIHKLEQSGQTHIIDGVIVKSRKKNSNKWFETQDNIGFWKEFSKKKIAWGNLNRRGGYALIPEDVYISAPACMIVPGDPYLPAILNSRVADFYIRSIGVVRNGGYIEYKPMFVEQVPIPEISDDIKKKIEDVNSSDLPTNEKEEALEKIVESLYRLTDEEINLLRERIE